jgi:hypothetical protein
MSTRTRLMALLLVAFLMTGTSASSHQTIDLRGCSGELDRMRRASRDATDSAESAASARDSLVSAKSTAESACRSGQSEYRCKSARLDLESAQLQFDSELSRFTSDYGTVQSRIRSVQVSCGDAPLPSAIIPGVTPANQSTCRTLRRLRDSGTPLERLRQSCTAFGFTDAECRACLGG